MQSVITAKLATLALGGIFSVNGSGTIKEEVRNVGDFSVVHVEHGFTATIAIGSKSSVTISADDNLLPLIRTEVKDGKLIVGPTDWKQSIRPSREVRVTIVTPQLKAVGGSGGSSITADGTTGPSFKAEGSGGSAITVKSVNADEIKVETSGGSTVRLSGRGKDLKISMSGGSIVKTAEVPTASVEISGSGGSQADVAASESLKADLSGGSRVHVKGNPAKRIVNRSGGAEVRFDAS